MSGYAGLVMILLAALRLHQVQGHGYMWEPPARGTMWRRGFTNVPTNYNDNQQFCGGFAYQISQRGRCGFCGDPYPGPYLHEDGPFATKVIGRTYTQGQTFEVEVRLTASHKGFFEFRLCVPPSPSTGLTAFCTDSTTHLLPMSNGQTRLNGIAGIGQYKVQLVLPSHIQCDFCMLQWRYHTGNSWGTEPNGLSCLGCGAQEEFYGCANIAISGTGGGGTPTPGPTPTPQPTPQPTAQPTPQPTAQPTPGPTAAPTPGPTPGPPAPAACRAVGPLATVPGMNNWCVINCSLGSCPASHCTCN